MQHQKWRKTFFLILNRIPYNHWWPVENQSIEFQMYTYFIVAKRYMFCR